MCRTTCFCEPGKKGKLCTQLSGSAPGEVPGATPAPTGVLPPFLSSMPIIFYSSMNNLRDKWLLKAVSVAKIEQKFIPLHSWCSLRSKAFGHLFLISSELLVSTSILLACDVGAEVMLWDGVLLGFEDQTVQTDICCKILPLPPVFFFFFFWQCDFLALC